MWLLHLSWPACCTPQTQPSRADTGYQGQYPWLGRKAPAEAGARRRALPARSSFLSLSWEISASIVVITPYSASFFLSFKKGKSTHQSLFGGGNSLRWCICSLHGGGGVGVATQSSTLLSLSLLHVTSSPLPKRPDSSSPPPGLCNPKVAWCGNGRLAGEMGSISSGRR